MTANIGQVLLDTGTHVAKSICAKVHTAVPARYNNQVIAQALLFENLQYDGSGTPLAIVIFKLPTILKNNRPGVVCRLGIFFSALQPG